MSQAQRAEFFAQEAGRPKLSTAEEKALAAEKALEEADEGRAAGVEAEKEGEEQEQEQVDDALEAEAARIL